MAAAAPQAGTRMVQPGELVLSFDFRRPAAPLPAPLPTAATVAEAISRWLNEQL